MWVTSVLVSYLAFAANKVIEGILLGYLGLNECPHNSLVVMRQDKLLEGIAAPLDFGD